MNKKKLIGIGVLIVLAAAMVALYFSFAKKPVEGSKSITIEIVNSAGESKKYDLKTDAQYLKDAMDEAEGLEFSGTESAEFGLSVEVINGESAIYDVDGAYWAFYVNGGYCNYGVSQQPIEDGDAFKIEYTLAQ